MNQFEEEYVTVNGIEHYLLHYPKAPEAPVLLYLHGGPGSFESLFAYTVDQAWGGLFTHVHWDQRGAGKTLCRNGKPGMPESVEQILDDLHGIVRYLQRKYQVSKVVLLGHSWGSLIGSLYLLKYPEDVLSYIGVGQVVSIRENERTAYQDVLLQAKQAGNKKHVQALKKLGDYPPRDPELLIKQMIKMRKIQETYDDGPMSGLGEMVKIIRHSPSFHWGDLISYLRAMKVNYPLQLQMVSFDLNKVSLHYDVPVHYILGELDNITPMSLGKAYFEKMDAPVKTFRVIPGAGHNPMYEKPAEFAAALRAVREMIQ